MLDILRLVRAVLELLVNLGQPLRALLLQPLMTVAILVFLYAGWHVRDECSVSAGLRVAFVDTKRTGSSTCASWKARCCRPNCAALPRLTN